MLFPVVYLFRPIVGEAAFVYVLYVMLFAVAFMFVLDVQVKKFDVSPKTTADGKLSVDIEIAE